MSDDLTVVLLFVIATGVAIAVRRFSIPYTVALAVVGVGLGSTGLFHTSLLRREVLFSVFLPGLVFEAAYHLKLAELRARAVAIVALAVPGVALGTLLIAGILVGMQPALGADALRFGPALVLGAIVSATDPIAVVALFRELRTPKGLSALVEGESLLNDGTGIALFALCVSIVSGASSSIPDAALAFARILALGMLVGGAIGAVTAAISRRVDDAMIEVTLTVIAAYGSFAVAERAGGSGVIATVVAALICGSYAESRMSPTTRNAVGVFWQFAAFAFNSLVFLSMGVAVRLGELAASWRAVGAAYLAMLLARVVLVALVTWALSRTRAAVPWRWSAVIVWGGVRGALSMVLALSLPDAFPHRDAIVVLTSGIVMSSLVLQGLSMAPLVRWLGLSNDADTQR